MSTILKHACILILLIGSGCNPRPETNAPDRNFYFSVHTRSASPIAENMKRRLEQDIPSNKYAITNSSALAWPYYQTIALNESVSMDSLAPPHSFIHKMIPYAQHQHVKDGEYVVQIELYTVRDTLPNYNVTIYIQSNDRRKLSATTGLHYIGAAEFKSENELYDVLFKSIIRYSFK